MKINLQSIEAFERAMNMSRRRIVSRAVTKMSPGALMLVVSLVIGAFTGCMAAMIKRMIELLNRLCLEGVSIDSVNWRFLWLPILGVILTSLYQRKVVGHSVARGTRIVKQSLRTGRTRMSAFTVFNPIIGCAMTLGLGASGGSEGPTALSGSAIASRAGQALGLNDDWMRILVGVGAAAGIAAIFKSPVGGMFFAIEVIQMQITTFSVMMLAMSCVIASTSAYILSDFTFDIPFNHVATMDPHQLGWVCVLALICGLYSIYYDFTKSRALNFFTRIKRPWRAALLTGAILSISVFLFPILFGEGFGLLTHLVNGTPSSMTDCGVFGGSPRLRWVALSVIGALLLKGILVAAACGGGGVSGDFVPTLFAGALVGWLFAHVINLIGADVPVWHFALIGMGAVMAGTIHAPMMALFICMETTNTYAFILPIFMAVLLSYGVVKLITPHTWYSETDSDDIESLLKIEGKKLRGQKPQ